MNRGLGINALFSGESGTGKTMAAEVIANALRLNLYRIDLSADYLGQPLPHPIGKGSGQLSLNTGQLETYAKAGLAFAVLKTVIAQDAAGAQSMAAWAISKAS